MASRSRSRYVGAVSSGKLSTSWWAAHAAVGWSVTLTWTSSRRWCRRIKNPKTKRKVSVGTTKKSTATMSRICASRKLTPRPGWPGRGALHVLGNGELGDLIAEKAEFGLDPAPAPGWVFAG